MPVSYKNNQQCDYLDDLKNFDFIETFQKLFDALEPERNKTRTELDPKRKLCPKDYFSLFLFSLINPVIKSMRGLCTVSKAEKTLEKVCSRPVSTGSFSEAQNPFDPQCLTRIIRTLAKQLPGSFGNKRIQAPVKQLIATDGTLIKALPQYP